MYRYIIFLFIICSSCNSKNEDIKIFELKEDVKSKFEKVVVPNDSTRYCIHYFSSGSDVTYFFLIKRNKYSSLKDVDHFVTLINDDTVFVFTGLERFAKKPVFFSSHLYKETFVVKDSFGITLKSYEDIFLHSPPPIESKVRFKNSEEE
jgi:hypothetical protein